VILVSYLVIHQNPKHIEYSIMPLAWWKKHMMWNLIRLMAPKEQTLENLDDVGDEPLMEAMKNMPIRAIKPKRR
jgi:hypothetical protein